MISELSVMNMTISMIFFVLAFTAVLIGIFLFVKGSLDSRKTIWIPAVIAIALGVFCIVLGFHFIKL